MNIKKIIHTSLLAATLLAAQSCGKKESDTTIEFETRTDSIGYLVPDFDGDSVYGAARYSVVWPEKIADQDFDALKDSLTLYTFGNGSDTFDQAARQFLAGTLDDMKNGNDSTFIYEECTFTEANNAMRHSAEYVTSTVSLLTPNILVIDIYREDYAYAAAHGMQTLRSLNYSIAGHLLLDKANAFKPGSKAKILSLINEAARQRYPEEGTLFPEPISSFDDFKVTENDIVFIYQPYDVAPYSSGIIEVPVSQYDLYSTLSPTAMDALGL